MKTFNVKIRHMAGRPSKSIAEKKASGTYRARDKGALEEVLKPSETIPDAPDDLTADQAKLWYKVCQSLLSFRLLSEHDGALLRRYVETTTLYEKAKADIKKYGLLVESKAGLRQNPAVEMQMKYANMLMSMEGQMGLTPKARQTLKAGEPKAKKESPITALLGGLQKVKAI